jgi:hypothetical protein
LTSNKIIRDAQGIVEGHPALKEAEPNVEEQTIESMFQGLWDRVRLAGELIANLRSQKQFAEERVSTLEGEVRQLRDQLSDQEEKLKSLTELQTVRASTDGKILSNGEREAIAEKAKKLLERIQEYL